MSLFEIDKATCTKCTICSKVCPVKIIDISNNGYPIPVNNANLFCIRCGHCVAACQTSSLNHTIMKPEDCSQIKDELHISEEQVTQFLRSRRSIRVFKDKSVSKDEISRIIDVAKFAPTARNSQPVKWLVICSKDEIQKIAGMTINWMKEFVTNESANPMSKVYSLVIERWENGDDVIFRNAPAVVVAYAQADDRTSGPIALTYLELAAYSMGLGGCWAGYFYRAALNYIKMQQALQLPDNSVCLGGMMIGHPKYKYYRIPTRKKVDIIWRM